MGNEQFLESVYHDPVNFTNQKNQLHLTILTKINLYLDFPFL
jgi:hypothetical protein